ncbi:MULTISPECIES: hypothetical protein [Klebsiella]|uniref:Uncharacterized protein n=1 Tax=Klebsiella quasipneumoniae subsp. quasipneumoniae TaxID=1667327 RepID=A0AAW8XRA7_9ENTR|nr:MULTISPECIES: hypothetical protein [Klebsiella]MDV0842218.1 hypothetical protein [Klebsiella quasipneumoniae subsp. quasipneumoniae]MEC5638843.1 hypothetical protein [Klebsiella quasipneumoniae]
MFISFSASRLVCRHYKQATTSDENGEMMEIHHCRVRNIRWRE